MSSDTKKTGRRRRRRSGDSSNPGSRSPHSRFAEPAKPKSFWEKIVAFFRGEAASAGSKSSRIAAKSVPRGEKQTASSNETNPEKAVRERKPRTEGIRRPEPVEVTTPRLYVGNLSFDATESDLFELFSGVGLVQNVEIICNKSTHRSKGFAFVQMQTVEEARRAVEELHDKEYMSRKLVVSGAKADERRSERESASPKTGTPAPVKAESASEEQRAA